MAKRAYSWRGVARQDRRDLGLDEAIENVVVKAIILHRDRAGVTPPSPRSLLSRRCQSQQDPSARWSALPQTTGVPQEHSAATRGAKRCRSSGGLP